MNAEPRRIGYARVSTDEQELTQQRQALERAGCVVVFEDDGVSGYFTAPFEREGFNALIAEAKPGDTIVVWKLDRLGRSVADLIATTLELKKRGLNFASVTEHIDTSSAMGTMVFQMLAIFAEFERNMISERTKLALHAKRDAGQKLGRPRAIDDKTWALIERLKTEKGHSDVNLAAPLGISHKTIVRERKRRRAEAAQENEALAAIAAGYSE